MRTRITGGLLVRTDGVFRGDLLMEDGKILELGENLPGTDAETVPADGLLVLPGGVDVHTHLELTVGANRVADGFASGTRAAAFGGTTTVVEHPGFGPEGCAPGHQIAAYRQLAAGRAAVDYAFHGVLQHCDEAVLNALPELVQDGIPSAKAYMTYAGKLDDQALLEVLAALGRAGGLLTVHAENHALTVYLARSGGLDPRDPQSHPRSRPAYCEAEAVNRIIALARAARAPLYVVHLSTAEGLAHIRVAQQRGERVFAETCPQYLVLDEARYSAPDALQYVMAPPLRTEADCRALWKGLADGSVDVVATDHCAFSLEQKHRLSQGSVFACPGGAAGVETRLPLLYAEGVRKSRLSLPRFVAVTATAPARIMGLNNKGALEPGLDADIVLFDPDEEREIRAETLHQGTDATPFAGMRTRGWPRSVWLRGTPLIRDGVWIGPEDKGHEIARQPLPASLHPHSGCRIISGH